jgi:hypothetical protein
MEIPAHDSLAVAFPVEILGADNFQSSAALLSVIISSPKERVEKRRGGFPAGLRNDST